MTMEYAGQRFQKWLKVAQLRIDRGQNDKARLSIGKAEYWLSQTSQIYFNSMPPEKKEELQKISHEILYESKSIQSILKKL